MLIKKKVRFIYSLNNKSFCGDLLLHIEKNDSRLSRVELLDISTNIDILAKLKEVINDSETITRVCVDYKDGIEIKKLNPKYNFKFCYYELDLKMFTLADQYEYLDSVFNNLIINDIQKKMVWESKSVFKDYSQLRSYIIALFKLGLSLSRNS